MSPGGDVHSTWAGLLVVALVHWRRGELISAGTTQMPACRKFPVGEHQVEIRPSEEQARDHSPTPTFVTILHQFRTTLVVAPLMLLEAATAMLPLWLRPLGVTIGAAVIGALLGVLIWASTILWQVPAHAKLEAAFTPTAHRWLVRSTETR